MDAGLIIALALAGVAGVLILLCGIVGGYRLGLLSHGQLRHTAREQGQLAKGRQRQLEAARDAVGRVRHDARTHPHTALQLDEVLETLEERAS